MDEERDRLLWEIHDQEQQNEVLMQEVYGPGVNQEVLMGMFANMEEVEAFTALGSSKACIAKQSKVGAKSITEAATSIKNSGGLIGRRKCQVQTRKGRGKGAATVSASSPRLELSIEEEFPSLVKKSKAVVEEPVVASGFSKPCWQQTSKDAMLRDKEAIDSCMDS